MKSRFSEKNLLEMDPKSSPQDIKEGLAIPAYGGSGNGKGDRQRESQISARQYARNYCRTFGHKRWDRELDFCRDCGMTREEQIALAGKEAPRLTTA